MHSRKLLLKGVVLASAKMPVVNGCMCALDSLDIGKVEIISARKVSLYDYQIYSEQVYLYCNETRLKNAFSIVLSTEKETFENEQELTSTIFATEMRILHRRKIFRSFSLCSRNICVLIKSLPKFKLIAKISVTSRPCHAIFVRTSWLAKSDENKRHVWSLSVLQSTVVSC